MSLSGKICLVTGSSKGIGRGIALQLGGHGATVYVTGRSKDKLDSCVEEINKRGGKGKDSKITTLLIVKLKLVSMELHHSIVLSLVLDNFLSRSAHANNQFYKTQIFVYLLFEYFCLIEL